MIVHVWKLLNNQAHIDINMEFNDNKRLGIKVEGENTCILKKQSPPQWSECTINTLLYTI